MISTGAYQKSLHASSAALGAKIVSSDATLIIEGFEGLFHLTMEFPSPFLSPGDAIEVPGPLGTMTWQPSQVKTAQQSSISFLETVGGHTLSMFESMIGNGGTFNAKVYEGTPDNYLRVARLYNCMITIDPTTRTAEGRSELIRYSGTMSYLYFGSEG